MWQLMLQQLIYRGKVNSQCRSDWTFLAVFSLPYETFVFVSGAHMDYLSVEADLIHCHNFLLLWEEQPNLQNIVQFHGQSKVHHGLPNKSRPSPRRPRLLHLDEDSRLLYPEWLSQVYHSSCLRSIFETFREELHDLLNRFLLQNRLLKKKNTARNLTKSSSQFSRRQCFFKKSGNQEIAWW